jgi:hypothetical protein
MRKEIKDFYDGYGVIYAECGGLMYLMKQLEYKPLQGLRGRRLELHGSGNFEMCGVIKGSVKFEEKRVVNYVQGELRRLKILFGVQAQQEEKVFSPFITTDYTDYTDFYINFLSQRKFDQVSWIAKRIKGRSSKLIRDRFSQLKEWCPRHLWAPSCYHKTFKKSFINKLLEKV